MRWFILLMSCIAVVGILSDAMASRWTGTTSVTCANVTTGIEVSERNFRIVCHNRMFTMRSGGMWSPEFRPLSEDEIRELYLDRPFQCQYSFVAVDTWYADIEIIETYQDCHQVHGPQTLRLRRYA
jgi:hypothetical protein